MEDSLLSFINSKIHDTTKVAKYIELASKISNRNRARKYLINAYELAHKTNYNQGEYYSLFELSFNYSVSGEWAKGMEYALKGIEKSKIENYNDFLSPFYNVMALCYEKQKDYSTALQWSKAAIGAITRADDSKQPTKRWAAYMSTSGYMFRLNFPMDSVFHYSKISIEFGKEDGLPENLYGYSYLRYAYAFAKLNKIDSAQFYFHKSLNLFKKYQMDFSVQEIQRDLAKFYFDFNKVDSAQYYATQAYTDALKIDNINVVIDVSHILLK